MPFVILIGILLVGGALGYLIESKELPATPEKIRLESYNETREFLCIAPGKEREDAYAFVFGFIEKADGILQAHPDANWDELKKRISKGLTQGQGAMVRTKIQILRVKAKASGGETDAAVRRAFIEAALGGMEMAAYDSYDEPYAPKCKGIDPFQSRH